VGVRVSAWVLVAVTVVVLIEVVVEVLVLVLVRVFNVSEGINKVGVMRVGNITFIDVDLSVSVDSIGVKVLTEFEAGITFCSGVVTQANVERIINTQRMLVRKIFLGFFDRNFILLLFIGLDSPPQS
jgi:hypothetical protein